MSDQGPDKASPLTRDELKAVLAALLRSAKGRYDSAQDERNARPWLKLTTSVARVATLALRDEDLERLEARVKALEAYLEKARGGVVLAR